MAFRLLLAAEKRWRGFNAPHLVALVKADVEFPDGEAEMFQCEPAPSDLFTHTPSVFATREVQIHCIRQYLQFVEVLPLPPVVVANLGEGVREIVAVEGAVDPGLTD